jgi:putative cardiolipin synthase
MLKGREKKHPSPRVPGTNCNITEGLPTASSPARFAGTRSTSIESCRQISAACRPGRIMADVAKWLVLLTVLLVSGCAILDTPPQQPLVYSLPPATSGVLAEVTAAVANRFGTEQSGFIPLIRNYDGLSWRLALADHATTSIDAQYFIWQDDAAGNLLYDRLLKAADRGVRVRLLVDDIALAAKEKEIASISNHPNFEIKIFNPGRVRNRTLAGMFEFLINFKKLNRRMHNKLFVVDNSMAIAGGRNIGNEYFGLGEKYNFRDLDVMAAGPVVEELSDAFDKYWNSEVAYPGAAMSKKASLEYVEKLRGLLDDYLDKHREVLASYPLKPKRWDRELLALPELMKPGKGHFLQDDPVSFDGEEHRLIDMIRFLAAPNHDELVIVTPYLIPQPDFLERLATLSSEGVEVKILTGSMGSNNHTMAHSHYKKYRRPLLATGAKMYEFRHDPSLAAREKAEVAPAHADFISLHIKALVGDRKRCFIGSLNLDPRAVEINTENGLYIESPELAEQLLAEFENMMGSENAWHLYLEKDELRWTSGSETVATQPARGFGQRIADFFFRLLPIESQL